MEIGKRLFDAIDSQIDREELYSDQTLRQIARMYSEFVYQYTGKEGRAGKRAYLLSAYDKPEKLKKTFDNLRKFVDITLELNVPFDVYMKSQFEIIVPFLKKKGSSLKYPTFPMLVSDKAKQRYLDYRQRVVRRFTGDDRKVEFYKKAKIDIEQAVTRSMTLMYKRLYTLKAGAGISRDTAVKELEMYARARIVSTIYVFSNPLADDSDFLREIKQAMAKKLSQRQREVINRVRRELKINELPDGEIVQYI